LKSFCYVEAPSPPVVVHYASRFVVEGETILEETIDLAGLGVNVDVEVAGSGRETRNGLDVGSERISDDLFSMN